ncbi:hypothetical protein MMC18_007174 [Xylographa bjoerkii]|nr:hypothetical protein [Xylographa bjoerkii]
MSFPFYDAYQHLITHIVPGPNSISYFIPLLLLPIALIIPPSVLSRSQLSLIFLPPIHACFLHSCLFGGGLDVISADVVVWSTVLIALQDVRGTYKRIHAVESQRKEPTPSPEAAAPSTQDHKTLQRSSDELPTWQESYPTILWPRVRWILALLPSIRLSGWKIGDPAHDSTQPPTPLTRRAYLRHAVLIAITSFLLLDTAAYIVRHDPYFTDRSISISSPYPSSFSTPNKPNTFPLPLTPFHILPPRILRPLVIATHIYALITLGGAVATTPLLLLPTPFSPHLYPMFFGPFSSVLDRGLRGLWGTWWHQTMRYPTSMPGRALAQYLDLPPGGRGDYALRTISAFGLSGWIHGGLVPPEPLRGVDAWKHRIAFPFSVNRIIPTGAAGLVDFGPYAIQSFAGLLALASFGSSALTEVEGIIVVRAAVAVVVDDFVAHSESGLMGWGGSGADVADGLVGWRAGFRGCGNSFTDDQSSLGRVEELGKM